MVHLIGFQLVGFGLIILLGRDGSISRIFFNRTFYCSSACLHNLSDVLESLSHGGMMSFIITVLTSTCFCLEPN